nr:IncQ-type mobilization protein MobB [Providencia rettgeri]
MNAIDRVKKSRGINELAEQIEPLAQSMATLADEARQVMSQTQQAASEAQAAEWLKAQRQTGAAWVELAKELREVAAEVSSAAQSARSASRGWHWKLWLTVMLASMMPTVVLLIASLLLLDLTPLTTEDGSIWLRLVARWRTTGLCRP